MLCPFMAGGYRSCGVYFIITTPFMVFSVTSYRRCRCFLLSSRYVPGCSYHVGYMWVLVNVSMTRVKIRGQTICVGIESLLRYLELHMAITSRRIFHLLSTKSM